MADARRSEFGDFLRSRRQRLTPEGGRPAGGRAGGARPACGARKWPSSPASASTGTSGSNRGATVNPSLTTIDALARALRLGKSRAQPSARARPPRRPARLRRARPCPRRSCAWSRACRIRPMSAGRRWDVLAWNKAAEEIFALGRMPEGERNTLLCMLTNPATRRLFGSGWADEARRMVAQFRATHDLWAGDPAFVDLLDAAARRAAPNSPAGGRRTTSATAPPASRRWPIRRRARCASSTRRFQANDDPGVEAGDLHAGLTLAGAAGAPGPLMNSERAWRSAVRQD